MKKLFTFLAVLLVTWTQSVAATNILGEPQITAQQAYQYIKSVYSTQANFTLEMAEAYINIGKKMGIRGDIAICQSIWETSWFRYTGGTAVTPDDHNYCGLGVTTLGQKGCQFDTVEEGVTAQLIHLWGYATTASLPSGFSTDQDPRWSALVSSGKRGCSPTWEGLGNGHWATASGYGTNIISTWNSMKAYNYIEPSLKASATTVSITAVKGATSPVNTVKITGSALDSDISLVSNASIIKYTKASGWNDRTGGTLNISVDTSKNAGTYTGGYIRVYSGSVEVKINVSVVITSEDGETGDNTGGDNTGGDTETDPDPVVPTETGVYVNPESLSFTVAQNATAPSKTVTVTGVNLSQDIAYNSNTKYITVAKGSDWNTRTGGSLIITVDTSRSPGEYTTGYVAVQSTTTYRKQIPVTVTITEPGSTPVVTTPTITVNPSSLSFAVEQGETSASKSITVVGENLESDLSIAASTSDITVTKASGWNARTGGTLNVTVKSSRDAGTYDGAYVAIVSGSTRKQVSVSYTVSVTDSGSDSGSSTDFVGDVTKMTSVWESSQNNGTKDWHVISSSGLYSRDIAYNNGNLYVLNSKPWANPTMYIVDAYTGAKKSELNVTTLNGKASVVNRGGAIAIFDGKLICITVTDVPNGSANRNCYIYKWDSDSAVPEIVYSYEGTQLLSKAFGHSVSASGTWANGRIWVTTQGSNEVVYFPVENSVVGAPQTITLKDAQGDALEGAADGRGTGRVVDNGDNTFWFNSTNAAPTLYKYDGTPVLSMKSTAFGDNVAGTGLAVQKFGKRTYLATITYLDKSNKAKSQFSLYDITDGADKVSEATITLSAKAEGFGSTKNDQVISTALLAADRKSGNVLDAWAAVPYQGIAHFSYTYDSATGVDDIVIEEAATDAPVEFYNLSGIRVDGENLAPGLYIRRQGNKATKVLVR